MNSRMLVSLGIALAMLSSTFAQSDGDRSARRERSRERGASATTRRGPVNPALEEFFTAAGAGDLEKVKAMLATDPSLATADDRQKETALHKSATGEIAAALLDAGAAIDTRDWLGVTPLHEAASENRIDVVRVLLDRGAGIEIPAERSGTTPLAVAAAIGYKEVVEVLIAKGANVNSRDLGDETPLMAAAGNPEIADILLAHGAELNAADKEGRTALDHALEEKRQPGIDFLKSRGAIGKNSAREIVTAAGAGDLETVRRMLAQAPQLLNCVSENNTMLGMAAFKGRTEVVEFLLQQGADIEALSSGEQTPLHTAADGGHPEIIKLLLAAGANTKARDNNGETPALAAANEPDPAGFELLFAADPDLTVRTLRGQTLLHRAALSESPVATRLLLERGAEVDARDNEGYTPLVLAIEGNCRDTIELLLAHKADVNVSFEGTRLLHAVIKSGMAEPDLVARLIAAGADVHALDSEGAPPLLYAVAIGNIAMAEALVAAGADVNAPASERKITPLHMAVDKEELAMVAWLLDHGADIEAKLASGDTPLLFAANAGLVDAGLVLLERGANPSAAYPNGDTLLHFAPLRLVEAALARGAGIEARRVDGATPLCMQAFNANLDVVKFLIAQGAQTDVRDNNGRPVLDYANFARLDAAGKSIETEDSIARKREIYDLLKPAGMALYEAAQSGDAAAAAAAIAKDAGAVNWKDNDAATPLHIAAFQGHKAVADALVAARSDPNARDKSEYTPLHYLMVTPSRDDLKYNAKDIDGWLERSRVMREQKTAILEILLAAGADMNAKTKDGVTPLDMAVADGAFTIADLLREKGAQCRPSSNEVFQVTRFSTMDRLKQLIASDKKLLKFKDEFGRTPFVYAAQYGSGDALRVLLDAGADINAASTNGETALHIAARKADQSMVAFLVEKKAKVNLRTKDGKTPLDYAQPVDNKVKNEKAFVDFLAINALIKSKGGKTGAELGPMKN